MFDKPTKLIMSQKEMSVIESSHEPVVVGSSAMSYEAREVEYQKFCRQLLASMKSIETNIIKVAHSLTFVKENRLYELDNYQNIYDFAKDKFSISKSTCSKYLGLISVFGIDLKLSSSQMIELLPYVRKGGDISGITPDMTRKQVRDYIKKHPPSGCDVATKFIGDGPVRDSKPQSFVFNITDDLFTGPDSVYEAFFADIQAVVISAHEKYGAKSIKIVIE